MRKRPSNAAILRTWDVIERDNPSKSTEWIMQMVCDMFNGRIDHGDVAEALAERHDEQEALASE